VFFLGLALSALLLSRCGQKAQESLRYLSELYEETRCELKELREPLCELKELPTEFLECLLPAEWEIEIIEEDIGSYTSAVPMHWIGEPECMLISAWNPTEKYWQPDVRFEYPAWHDFWFCPEDWEGECILWEGCELPTDAYPARFLCDCHQFKIFHLSIGQNSQADLPERVKDTCDE